MSLIGRRPQTRGYDTAGDISERSSVLSALHEEVRAAILRPAGLATVAALRPLLAIADRHESRRRDALRDEIVHRGFGAPIAERQVVFFRSALVAVALDQDARVRVGPEPSGIRIENLGVAGSDRILVEVEVHVDEITNSGEFDGRGPRIGCA